MSKFIILIDPREQKPLVFPKRVKTQRVALRTGDYSLYGCQGKNGIVVERKSLDDLFSTVAVHRNHIRFRKELKRMGEFAFKAVIVEAHLNRVYAGTDYSKADGYIVARALLADCMEFQVAPIFCHSRWESTITVLALFEAFFESGAKKIFQQKDVEIKLKVSGKQTLAERLRTGRGKK